MPQHVLSDALRALPLFRFTEPAAWAKAALSSFRVLLLDQRGTGLSSKITPGVVARLPGSAADKAAHLGHFRADSIVRDCEAIRKALGATQGTLLGQSFGGFCAVLYLSRCPDSLRQAPLLTWATAPLRQCITAAPPASATELKTLRL